MHENNLTVVQSCGECGEELGSFDVKKDNMMLMTTEKIWCPKCQAETREVRDLAGRSAAIKQEQGSYAANNPVDPATRPQPYDQP